LQNQVATNGSFKFPKAVQPPHTPQGVWDGRIGWLIGWLLQQWADIKKPAVYAGLSNFNFGGAGRNRTDA
jgi:hypothetical protein